MFFNMVFNFCFNPFNRLNLRVNEYSDLQDWFQTPYLSHNQKITFTHLFCGVFLTPGNSSFSRKFYFKI